MLSEEFNISVDGVGKRYEIYAQPADRLKQMVLPRTQRIFNLRQRSYFKEFWALRNVSFKVGRGESVGIVGRNGSGKSTLLQVICGTLNPTVGNAKVRGRIAALLELGAGFNPEFTGRENVFLSGLLYGFSERELRERYDAICDFAGIGDFIDQPVKTYSSGMAVRLAFSVAINVDPEILVVDEALAVGDELFQRKCFSRIESIRASGATILFVSHSASAVIELCDRAILIDSGELLAEGRPKDVVNMYQRLLYAAPDKAAAIRDDIRLAGRGSACSDRVRGAADDVDARGQAPEETTERDAETFDPDLRPATTTSISADGARIEDSPCLQTSEGRQVNGLIRGRRYSYRYEVRFLRSFCFARFGMSIKSISGFPICGTLSSANLVDGVENVKSGQLARIEFQFDCLLNPGIYFMNAGVFGVKEAGREEVLLHRLSDTLAFRVLPVTNNLSTEIVDLNCTSIVNVDD